MSYWQDVVKIVSSELATNIDLKTPSPIQDQVPKRPKLRRRRSERQSSREQLEFTPTPPITSEVIQKPVFSSNEIFIVWVGIFLFGVLLFANSIVLWRSMNVLRLIERKYELATCTL